MTYRFDLLDERMIRMIDNWKHLASEVKDLRHDADIESVKPKRKKEVFNDDLPF